MAATTITFDLAFRNEAELRSAYHAFANLINVVHAELQLLERMGGNPVILRVGIRLCETATRAFRDAAEAEANAPALAGFGSRVREIIGTVAVAERYVNDAEEARTIIRDVLDDTELRIQELLARHAIVPPVEPWDRDAFGRAIAAGIRLEAGSLTDDAPAMEVDMDSSIALPAEVPSVIGRLAGALLANGDGVRIVARARTDGVTLLVNTEPQAAEVVPAAVPFRANDSAASTANQHGDAARFARRVARLLAHIAHAAGPRAQVSVDPDGDPLLTIRLPDSSPVREQ